MWKRAVCAVTRKQNTITKNKHISAFKGWYKRLLLIARRDISNSAMRGILLFLLVAFLGLAWAQRINEAELNNEALSRMRINCLLDRGPCDKTGNLLKGF